MCLLRCLAGGVALLRHRGPLYIVCTNSSIMQLGQLRAGAMFPGPVHHGLRFTQVAAAVAPSRQTSAHSGNRQATSKRQSKQPTQHPLQSSAPRPIALREDHFYAEKADSFPSLGLSMAVCEALKAAGYTKPSRVQVWLMHAPVGCCVVLASTTCQVCTKQVEPSCQGSVLNAT